MRVWIALLFFLLFSLTAFSATETARTISFEELPNLVKERNENIKAAQSTVLAREQRTGRLKRSFFPSLSAQVGGEQFQTGPDPTEHRGFWLVEGSVNLYRGGRDRLEDKVRLSEAKVASAELATELVKEIKEARETYWKLVAIAREIADVEEAFDRNEASIKSARRRAGAGVTTGADALQFELHKTILSQSLKKLRHEQDVFRSQLAVALGMDDHESLTVATAFPTPSDSDLNAEAAATDTHPEIRAFNERAQVDRLRGDQASRWWLPKVDLYSSYGLPALSDEYTRALRNEREWTAGVRLGFSLSDAIEEKLDVQARRLEAQALENRSAHKTREIKAADHELRHDLKLTQELIRDADRDIDTASRFLKLTENEYSRGVKNGPDLLSAFQQLYEFRKRRTELYLDYHTTRAELAALTSKMESP